MMMIIKEGKGVGLRIKKKYSKEKKHETHLTYLPRCASWMMNEFGNFRILVTFPFCCPIFFSLQNSRNPSIYSGVHYFLFYLRIILIFPFSCPLHSFAFFVGISLIIQRAAASERLRRLQCIICGNDLLFSLPYHHVSFYTLDSDKPWR